MRPAAPNGKQNPIRHNPAAKATKTHAATGRKLPNPGERASFSKSRTNASAKWTQESHNPDQTTHRANATLSAGLFLFIALKPIYLWSSGLPQLADFILATTIGLSIPALRHAAAAKRSILAPSGIAIVFAYYATTVNLVAMLITGGGARFAFSSLFIIYNVLVLWWLMKLLNRHARTVIRAVATGTLAGLLLQLGIVLASGDFDGGRAVGSFNNPNQLGYYGVLSAAILLAAGQVLRARPTIVVAGLAIGSILVATSLSKAAIGSMAILIIGMAVFGISGASRGRLGLRLALVVTLIIGTLILPRLQWFQDLTMVKAIQQRFEATEADDSLAARGYNRILDHPEYWIFGAGEGGYDRFGSEIEFHSLLGNLQVSYGLFGLALFAIVIVIAVRSSGILGAYLMAAVFFYGTTHNGLRNTLLWVLIGILASTALRAHATKPTTNDPNENSIRRQGRHRKRGASHSEGEGLESTQR